MLRLLLLLPLLALAPACSVLGGPTGAEGGPNSSAAACADDPLPNETGPILRNSVLTITDDGPGTTLDFSACVRFVPPRGSAAFYNARATATFLDQRGNRIATETRYLSFPTSTGAEADPAGGPQNLSLPFVELSTQGITANRIDHAEISPRVVFQFSYAGCSGPGDCNYNRTITVNRVVNACVIDAARPSQINSCPGGAGVAPVAAPAPPPAPPPRPAPPARTRRR